MIPDAATVADRWAQSAGQAQTRFTEGVQSTTKDPTSLAIGQQAKLVQNFNSAVQNGRWQRGLQKVGKQGWQAATIAKAQNYSVGVNAAKSKYAEAIAPVLAVEAQLQSQIASMPSATIQDSINRATAWMTGLHNWAQSR
jgi:hypothetical protein